MSHVFLFEVPELQAALIFLRGGGVTVLLPCTFLSVPKGGCPDVALSCPQKQGHSCPVVPVAMVLSDPPSVCKLNKCQGLVAGPSKSTVVEGLDLRLSTHSLC